MWALVIAWWWKGRGGIVSFRCMWNVWVETAGGGRAPIWGHRIVAFQPVLGNSQKLPCSCLLVLHIVWIFVGTVVLVRDIGINLPNYVQFWWPLSRIVGGQPFGLLTMMDRHVDSTKSALFDLAALYTHIRSYFKIDDWCLSIMWSLVAVSIYSDCEGVTAGPDLTLR